jgi:phytoene synthase
MSDLSSCADLVRRHDRDRFLTGLFAPADRRDDLYALYAFNLEIARVRELVSEPMLGQIRLQWWRDTIDDHYAGHGSNHEVGGALGRAIAARGLDRAPFDALIDAREFDLEDRPPKNMAELKQYAEQSSSNLTLLALAVLGQCEGAAYLAGRHVGLSWALTGLLRAVPFHAAQRRLYLPADLVAEAGIDAEDIFAGRAGATLRPVMEAVAAEARNHLGHARDQRGVAREACPLPPAAPAAWPPCGGAPAVDGSRPPPLDRRRARRRGRRGRAPPRRVYVRGRATGPQAAEKDRN